MPKKITRQRRDGHNIAVDEDDDEPLLLDQPKKPVPSSSKLPTQPTQSTVVGSLEPNSSPQKPILDDDVTKMKIDKLPDADSDTEPESDEDIDMKDEPASTMVESQKIHSQESILESQTQSQGGVVGADRPAGHLVGFTNPLADFKACAKDSAKITQAVDDFGHAIVTIVHRPFASKRYNEMVDCLRVLRSTCLKVGFSIDRRVHTSTEQLNHNPSRVGTSMNGTRQSLSHIFVITTNSFPTSLLSDLKQSCVGASPGNRAFWETLRPNTDLTPIGKSEASASGSKSRISDESASKVSILASI